MTQEQMEHRIRRLETAVQCLAALVVPGALDEAAPRAEDRREFFDSLAAVLSSMQSDLEA